MELVGIFTRRNPKSLKPLHEGVNVYHVDDAKKLVYYLYTTYKDNIIISLMNQYTPLRKLDYTNLNRKLKNEEYQEVIDYALDLGVKYAFIQEGETQSESFIPNFDCSMI